MPQNLGTLVVARLILEVTHLSHEMCIPRKESPVSFDRSEVARKTPTPTPFQGPFDNEAGIPFFGVDESGKTWK